MPPPMFGSSTSSSSQKPACQWIEPYREQEDSQDPKDGRNGPAQVERIRPCARFPEQEDPAAVDQLYKGRMFPNGQIIYHGVEIAAS